MNRFTEFLGQIRITPLHFQLRRLRWMVFPALLILVAIYQFALYLIADVFPITWQWWVQLLIYTLTGSVAAWLGLTWIAEAASKRYEAESHLRQAYAELEENHNQLLALSECSQH